MGIIFNSFQKLKKKAQFVGEAVNDTRKIINQIPIKSIDPVEFIGMKNPQNKKTK